MPSFPTSRRGQQNVKPDLMIDLSRRVAENAYDKKSNPGGIVDMGSSINEMMLEDLVRWQKKHETSEDRRKCRRPNSLPVTNHNRPPHTGLPTRLTTDSFRSSIQ